MRMADGAGVSEVFFVGLTPHPAIVDDIRMPWEVETVAKKLNKTALGAFETVAWSYWADITSLKAHLDEKKIGLVALELSIDAVNLFETEIRLPVALLVGHEREGVSSAGLNRATKAVFLPMYGKKESHNVSTTASIAVYELVRRLHAKV